MGFYPVAVVIQQVKTTTKLHNDKQICVGKSISKLQIDVGYYMFEWDTWGHRH
jgi:hypothetical protein